MQYGSSFHGTDSIKTSVANEEILPTASKFYKFSLMNEGDSTVSINGSDPIFLKSGIGFSTDQSDVYVKSFKFLEDNIQYFWVGGR
ncbi:hypothetical protein JOC34_000462 [Virgibacillus halotolerans]|uniref:hypothetical protein n=1 Tax=Virgibacillus halotolerans TaxID=1071053 RepID=UPI00195F4803|nr:hypothetical protein [Virgibacillus halotolerans]MBM7598105.1 hypothetical protein [Virgibacillus halotolerans]